MLVSKVLTDLTLSSPRYAFSAISDSMDEQDEAPLMTDAFGQYLHMFSRHIGSVWKKINT